MSVQRIRDALPRANSALIKDTEQDKLYRFPEKCMKTKKKAIIRAVFKCRMSMQSYSRDTFKNAVIASK
jgi:hypothetical protein